MPIYPRPRKISLNPNLAFLRCVSGVRLPGRIFHCRPEQLSDALDQLILAWFETRSRTRPDGKSVASLAVGYRFDTSRLLPENPELDTQFTDSSGEECGQHRVKFLKAQDHSGYRIDNSGLESLLTGIASCAGR
jgi:hypothetical protein